MTMRKISLLLAAVGFAALCGGRIFAWGGGGELPPSDFVTGGGWIVGTPSGAKGNFGVGGGVEKGAFWGHLNYPDHWSGPNRKATSHKGYGFHGDRTPGISRTNRPNHGDTGDFPQRAT